LTDDGQLLIHDQGQKLAVKAVRCFPWSRAAEHISLRDDKNREVCFVDSVSGLDQASRSALQRALELGGFVIEVTRVLSVGEDYEIRLWKVETRQGPRSFQTALDNWPRSRPNGGHIIEDIAGDLFSIPELSSLDPQSQKLLGAYVD
jgi:hypothetical protein